MLQLGKEKSFLATEYQKDVHDEAVVWQLMEQTYPLQREDINSSKSICCLLQEWPFLVKKIYFLKHYEKLLNISFVSYFGQW